MFFFKLDKLDIDYKVSSGNKCFLTNRSQFITRNEENSCHRPVTSGLPQGTVWGPLLFRFYINDSPMCVSSSISFFADDCVIYCEVTNESDAALVQADLCVVSEWCNLWNMILHTNKCEPTGVSFHNTSPSPYSTSKTQLTTVPSFKYLGVHIISNLS